jgi:hypothetical protein
MRLPDGVSLSWLAQFARERGEETFRRLWLLEKHGYFRRPNSFDGGALELEPYAPHLPKIFLYPDGKVVAIGNVDCRINPDADQFEQDRIDNLEAADIERFDRWIQQVPLPNTWQRMKKFRDDVTAWGCLILLLGISYVVGTLLIRFISDLLGFH